MTLRSAILFLAALGTVVALSRPPAEEPRTREGPVLPRAQLLHLVGAAQQPLVADYYWIRTLNQIGRASTPEEYRDLYAYANLVTDLDPHFPMAYVFPSLVIPVDLGREQWVNADESTQLLRKGLRALPDNFRIRFQLAYNLMFFHRQFREAADLLRSVAGHPEAPAFIPALATRLYAQAGDIDASLGFATLMRDSAQDAETREFYERRILEIHQERMLQQVDRAVQAFRQREGRLPTTLEELVAAKDLKSVPFDPLGGILRIGEDGRARSSAEENRLELIKD